MSGSVAGAEITTFFAPASRCFWAPSRLVKKPVDSSTTSTPRSPHGIAPGSRSESSLTSSPPARMTPPCTSTSPSSGPSVESYLSRCDIVATSPRSFAATISISALRSSCARKKFRPIRPKPLIPTRIAIPELPCRFPRRSLSSQRVLAAQVAQVRLGIEAAARDPLDQLPRHELAPMAPEILLEPGRERTELALLELVVQIRDLDGHLLPQLPGDDVAERVGGEVPDRADGPVHDLEHAERVVRRLHAQVVLHPLVPDLRQLLEVDRVGEQLLLELEAEDDVEVVRRLVRLDADQRRLDPVDRAVPVLEARVAERLREGRLQLGVEVAPERQAAADHVLPHPALGLVEAERGAVRERGRDRVHRRVEPPLGRVEAEALDHLELELLLALDRERGAAERTLPTLAHRGDERNLLLLQPVEDGPHLRRLHPRLEVVEEDVVRLVVVVEALDVAPPQLEVLAQRGQELGEVRFLPRLHPHRHRERRRARHLRPQLGGHASRLLPVTADEPDQARLVGVGVEFVLDRRELVEQATHLVGGERLVREPAHRRQLLGANARTAGRHLHLLVPAEQRRGPVEIVDLADPLLQGRERRFHARKPILTGQRASYRCRS